MDGTAFWFIKSMQLSYEGGGVEASCDLRMKHLPAVPLGRSFNSPELRVYGTTCQQRHTHVVVHFHSFQVHRNLLRLTLPLSSRTIRW